MSISVVIPAYNAQKTLPMVLSGLIPQIQRVKGEIVVVEDGASDPPLLAMEDSVRVIRQPHLGAAAARNHGARQATGDIVLFLGADIIPLPNLVAFHIARHRQYPDENVGCLGHVTWDPALPPTPWMVFLEHGGPQNAYDHIAGQQWVSPASYMYGSNVSLKTSLFQKSKGFDEHTYRSYGWEDLEFGIRLARTHNFTLLYEPLARGLHHHHVSMDDSVKRMRSIGAGARRLKEQYPDIPLVHSEHERWAAPLRRILFPLPIRAILRAVARYTQNTYILPRLYTRVLSFSFFDGFYAQ